MPDQPETINTTEKVLSRRSPLRYPGGKKRAVSAITAYFPTDLKTMVSPFFGGGSIELSLAAKGVKVIGFDVFQPLVEFWQCVTTQPKKLAAVIQAWHPLTKKDFLQLQRDQTGFTSKIKRAAAYYVINRASFSGATLSGGMSLQHPRFTPSSIERIRHFYNPNIQVAKASFERSLLLYKDVFTYLDPPYLIKNSLYGKKGNAHKNFDHQLLADLLKNRNSWILSYNDCAEIRELYNGFAFKMPQWKYGMSIDKISKEVLIFSKDLS